ncbi:MAG: dTDP-glucose 4,6-dehydratase [Polyangiaceae bacterium]
MSSTTLLVTGGAGFIGSNFVLSMVRQQGHRVVNLDALTYAGNLANLKVLDKNPAHRFVHGDIGDRKLVAELLEAERPSAIVHFAAESHVDRSIDSPDVFIDTNVKGTLNLLQAVRAHVQKGHSCRFVHVSTDEVFGSLGPEGYFTETSPVQPNSPYSASKAASDHLVRAFHHTYGLDTVTTNCSNNYGPYQFPEKLLPLMVLNALEGKRLPVYGDGLQRRDWIYVGDHVDGVRRALEKGKPGETYLLGGRSETTNLDLVHMLCDVLEQKRPASKNEALVKAGVGAYRDLVTFVTDRPGHDRRYAIDPSFAERELGFERRETLSTGLARTIEWYLDNLAWCHDITETKYKRERLGGVSHPQEKEKRAR